jgi:hypothetical protein
MEVYDDGAYNFNNTISIKSELCFFVPENQKISLNLNTTTNLLSYDNEGSII